MDPRVQRLDPAVEALREAGQLLDPGDRDAGRGDAAPAVEPVDTISTPAAARARDQVLEAGLVVHAHQRAPDRTAPVTVVTCDLDLSSRRRSTRRGPAVRRTQRAGAARRP